MESNYFNINAPEPIPSFNTSETASVRSIITDENEEPLVEEFSRHELLTMDLLFQRRPVAKSDQGIDSENEDGYLIVTGDAMNIVLDESSLQISEEPEVQIEQEPEEIKGDHIEHRDYESPFVYPPYTKEPSKKL